MAKSFGDLDKKDAGKRPDGYDYGVFKLTDLFARALHGCGFTELSKKHRDGIISRTQDDVSDHMPAWIRLPVPGAGDE